MIARVQRLERRQAAWAAAVVLSAAWTGRYAGSPTFARFAFAFAFVALVVGLGLRHPRPLLLGLPVWLVALGLVRRLLSGVSDQGAADPLLLVAPAALLVLTWAAVRHGAFSRPTRLSRLVALYGVATCFGALNPTQPSIAAGVTALLFFLPMLAFWIGRGLVDDGLLRKMLLVVAVAAIPAVAYGLRQTFVGFPHWDQAWIQARGYRALDVGGAIRPFATFSSAAEYATFLAIAMLVWLRLGPRKLLRPIGVAVALVLAVGVFYQSSRGSVVLLVAAGAVMTAAWRRLPFVAAAVLGAAALLVLPTVVQHAAPNVAAQSGTPASALVQHQIDGLTKPFDPGSSTAGAHARLIAGGVRAAFRDPLGQGIGSVTLAGQKFGGATATTEADPSNAAVALGLPGLVLFLALFVTGFGAAYRLARGGDRLAGVALGILAVTTLQWLNGGQYAVAFLPWLVLGWVDAHTVAGRDEAPAAEPEASPRPAPPPRPRRRPARPIPAPVQAPREWNVFALQRIMRQDHFERHMLISLRSYATLSGALPAAFDPLVRDVFGDRLQEDT